MPEKESPDAPGQRPAMDRAVAKFAGLVVLAIVATAVLAYVLLSRSAEPPPKEIAGDPWLVQGRELFLARCAGCHGATGRGDGPIGKNLVPKVGDLTSRRWKHGEAPGQVLEVVGQGVKNTSMPGWKTIFGPDDLRSVTAYVYHVGGRDVPEELRKP